jgi:hypothetical protein
MIAALYVYADGPYAHVPDCDVWDISRDARGYDGPHPVVAHTIVSPRIARAGADATVCA